MKLRWYRSATVGIVADNGRDAILCDPWLTDGAFIGSWFHWPPLEGDQEFRSLVEQPWSAIYVSHLHADHLDRKFLSAYLRRWPKVKLLIPEQASGWLRRALEALGATTDQLVECRDGDVYHFGALDVQIFPADSCDPTFCGMSTACFAGDTWRRSIDSLAVIRGDGQTIVNANDVMAIASVPRVFDRIGRCDILMAAYGGAGPYPQCFPDVRNKSEVARDLASKFVSVVAAAAERLQCRYVFPFAGQYLLGGQLARLNDDRAILDLSETKGIFESFGVVNVFTLAPFGEFDLTADSSSGSYEEPSAEVRRRYLERISSIEYPYEQSQMKEWTSFRHDIEVAGARLRQRYLALSKATPPSLREPDASFVIESDRNRAVFDFIGDDLIIGFDQEPRSPLVTTVSLDDRLFQGIVRRRPDYRGFTPYHWNQAEIGSHLFWQRSGEFLPDYHYLFNFLQSN